MSSLPSPARNIYGQGYIRKVETQLPERPPSTRRPGAALNSLGKNFPKSTLLSRLPSGKGNPSLQKFKSSYPFTREAVNDPSPLARTFQNMIHVDHWESLPGPEARPRLWRDMMRHGFFHRSGQKWTWGAQMALLYRLLYGNEAIFHRVYATRRSCPARGGALPPGYKRSRFKRL